MENRQETPIKEPMKLSEDRKTPPQQDKEIDPKSLNSSADLQKSGNTPGRLNVPKAFKYPERYRSPTDLMMSPATKGLLARNRKGSRYSKGCDLFQDGDIKIIGFSIKSGICKFIYTMENRQETPIKEPMKLSEDLKTPPQQEKEIDPKYLNSSADLQKSGNTPGRLNVPKAFKYPERYRSPTDLMMSPATKGLLARNRKGSRYSKGCDLFQDGDVKIIG